MHDEIYIQCYCTKHGLTNYKYINSAKKFKCVKCRSEYTQRRRYNLKEELVKYKGGKCEICGYNKCYAALEFHHKDPNEKDFGLASKGYTRNIEECKKEVDKCILVCANCHREIHDEINKKNIFGNVQTYEEKIINDMSYTRYNRKRSKISIDKEYVLSLINENYTQKEISKILNISWATLKRFLKENGISTMKHIPDSDNQLMIKLMKEHENYTKVGEIMGLADNTIKKRFYKLGYPTSLKKLLEILKNE